MFKTEAVNPANEDTAQGSGRRQDNVDDATLAAREITAVEVTVARNVADGPDGGTAPELKFDDPNTTRLSRDEDAA